MYIELSDLFWLLMLSLLGLYWWHSKGVKESALAAVSRHCHKLDLQLLDHSIGLRGLWLKRDSAGKLHFWRSYNFDFSAQGDDRYKGRIVLLGKRIESIELEPHRINE